MGRVSSLSAYYSGMQVLLTEQGFYDLTYRYFQKAASEGVVYAEVFFDPQAHTSRGVDFETVISGIHRAQKDARQELGIESGLIMCFLRDMSAESAMEHLHMSLSYKHWIIGVGLDSDERENPPSKFAEVFFEARKHGFRLTMHCDVNQQDSLLHTRECLDQIGVDRLIMVSMCLKTKSCAWIWCIGGLVLPSVRFLTITWCNPLPPKRSEV